MLLRRKLFLSSTVLFFLFSLVVSVEADSLMWSQTYGGGGGDWFGSVVETSDGGYALAGFTDSYGVGSYDVWLVKTDEFGNVEWNQTYGGTNYEKADSLVETVDGGYAIAGYRQVLVHPASQHSDAWLVKTDASGNAEWNKTYGGSGSEWAKSLVATSDGGYALAGFIDPFGAENTNFWLIKTDEFGDMEWNQTYGGTGRDEAYSLVATSDGGYAIAGTWNNSYGGDGGNGEGWLVKTDEFGDMEWNMTYGGDGDDEFRSLVETADGGYALGGTWDYKFDLGGSGVTGDVWLVKTNASGNMEWNMTYGGELKDEGCSVVATSDGGYAVGGSTLSVDVSFSHDFWLIKTNEYGSVPEAAWVVLPLLMIATLAIFISRKKLLNKLT